MRGLYIAYNVWCGLSLLACLNGDGLMDASINVDAKMCLLYTDSTALQWHWYNNNKQFVFLGSWFDWLL
jgi:hypothetical protein